MLVTYPASERISARLFIYIGYLDKVMGFEKYREVKGVCVRINSVHIDKIFRVLQLQALGRAE